MTTFREVYPMKNRKNDTIRGVSIHSTGSCLEYYVHYESKGTVQVEENEYYQAIYYLELWKLNVEENKKTHIPQ
jgi:hypothetical protein